MRIQCGSGNRLTAGYCLPVPCHVFMPADWKTAWGCGSGCRDALIRWWQMSDCMQSARRLAAGATSGQRRSTERLGGPSAREKTAAAAGTAVVSHRHGPGVSSVWHTRPDGPVRASLPASSIDSDCTRRSGLAQCGQHTLSHSTASVGSTASVVSVSAGGSVPDGAASAGSRVRQWSR